MSETIAKPWYDTREGFDKALRCGLASLRELAKARTTAGHDRKERLGTWIIQCHFWFDACGNTMVITENAPDYYSFGNKYPPDVISEDEWRATDQKQPMSMTMGSIPPSVEVCPRCLEGWTLRNVNNYKAVSFVRKDATPEEEEANEVWGWNHYHEDCHKLMVQQNSAEFFKELLDESGIVYTEMRAIPNGYSSSYPSSWWIVETTLGPIKIGHRKRVYSISWDNAPGLKEVDGREIFADQQVTKGKYLVHAWGKDDAMKYLWKLVEGL